jgi:hypothetical protein
MVTFKPKDISTKESEQDTKVNSDPKLDTSNQKLDKETSSNPERAKNKTSQFLIKDLPSKYLSYPENSRILADTYSYGEIKRLSDSKLPLDLQYEILLEGNNTENFNKNDITFFDFIYINVLRKLSSMKAPSFSVSVDCPKCHKTSSFDFGLEKLSFSELEIPKLPIVIDFISIGKLEFMPLTIGSFISLVKSDKYYQKDKDKYILDTEGKKLRDSVALMAAQCSSLPFEMAYQIINNLRDDEDIKLLEQVDGLLEHGIEPLKVTCKQKMGEVPKEIIDYMEKRKSLNEVASKLGPMPDDNRPICDQIININLIGGEVIIRPFRGSDEPAKSRISFGN